MGDVADFATLDLLDPDFAEDMVAAIQSGIAAGVVFPCEPKVEEVFRSAVQAAAGAIERRYDSLLRDFLVRGPYPCGGEIPADQAGKVLSDEETATVLSCMQGYIINHFKGALAELLSLPVLVRVLNDLKE